MHIFQTLFVAALTLMMAACGGSSPSQPAVSPEPALSESSLQGLWRSPVGASNTLSAVVLPDGKLWALMSNTGGSSVIKGALSVQNNAFVGTGKRFDAGATTVTTVALTANVIEKSSLSGVITNDGLSEPYALAYQPRYDSAATLADFAGTWKATLGPGVVSWTLTTAGELSGIRTTGCTYTGQLAVRAEKKAVVDVSMTENCAGIATVLSGVAVKSEDKLSITMLLTNANESAGVVVILAQ